MSLHFPLSQKLSSKLSYLPPAPHPENYCTAKKGGAKELSKYKSIVSYLSFVKLKTKVQSDGERFLYRIIESIFT